MGWNGLKSDCLGTHLHQKLTTASFAFTSICYYYCLLVYLSVLSAVREDVKMCHLTSYTFTHYFTIAKIGVQQQPKTPVFYKGMGLI